MSTRHRFANRNNGTLCLQAFGGVAQCNLPKESPWHYQDNDHPYSPNPDYPNECGWVMQDGSGHTCAGDVQDAEHNQEEPPSVSQEAVTMVMQYPKAEEPTVVQEPDWRKGNVYPPSDDGGRPVGGQPQPLVPPNMPSLEKEVHQYRWTNHEGGPDPVNEAAEAPEWALAVQWLRSEELSLSYGPWPIRKFVLCDAPDSNPSDEGLAYAEYVQGLEVLAQDYTVQVYRPEGRAWRFALVTWGWAHGYSIEVACDELAAMYG